MKPITLKVFLFIILFTSIIPLTIAQHSVARDWNEEVLFAVRNDFARPTVHARNLFHSSVLLYDAWALFDDLATTVFIGKEFGGFAVDYEPIPTPDNIEDARKEIMSYAMYRLLNHRFSNSPGFAEIQISLDELMMEYEYDTSITSTDYAMGNYAALGNYFAEQMIAFGLQDGSNEQNGYENQFYDPSNEPLILELYEDNGNIDPDRWQPLAFDVFVDQSGNAIPQAIPDFLSPEWGAVIPFALSEDDKEILNNGFDSVVYNDPGAPVYIEDSSQDGIDDPYKWHFSLVAAWSSHLDPEDTTMIDISPGSSGNLDTTTFPETFEEYKSFYNYIEGGDPSSGHTVNPTTGMAYDQQLVKRGDYARVLAEFWADGPDSETPPGHWFTILNYVSDQESLEKRIGGEGPLLSDLEWDVKTYLALGGAMHDAAITVWGIKGYYDYIRPISAIRYMAAKGQSSDQALPNFDPKGLPLVNDHIELVQSGDPLAGDEGQNVGELKIRAWKGPDFIEDPTQDIAGVDWILAKRWWPYQRGTFVTPPFAGYVSGHSTFSRAAAESLTLLTGDAFFPDGLGVFEVQADDFLVFEKGPSESFQLQWATYRDASDQSSLSRIWGGIHPPIDDIPGRVLGLQIGVEAVDRAVAYFDGVLSVNTTTPLSPITLYPNPTENMVTISTAGQRSFNSLEIYDLSGRQIIKRDLSNAVTSTSIDVSFLPSGFYMLKTSGATLDNTSIFLKK